MPGCVRFRGRILIPFDPRAGHGGPGGDSLCGHRQAALPGGHGQAKRKRPYSSPASHTQLSGTNVQVTREPTFPSGINVSKRPELLLLPSAQYGFRPLELN